MEGSIMGGPILSAPAAGTVIDTDPSLHQFSKLHEQQQALSHHLQGLAPLSTTQQPNLSQHTEQSLGYESKGTPRAGFLCKFQGKSAGTSDEDEPSFTEEEGDFHGGGIKSKKSSPWQRIKWTDSMVKLLINVVFFVGEDGTIESHADGNKRKSGLLQKKGKWKSVSCVMNERGCAVSPQQCEDKFNDLNKRYKRLNDILGKGTACFVVENPNLLDTMDHLSLKVKEDVKKILSSKHLFYKEMCSYHTGCKPAMSASFEFHQPCLQQTSMLVNSREGLEVRRPLRSLNDLNEDEEDVDEEDEEEDSEEHDDENEAEMHVETLCDFSSHFGKNGKVSKHLDGFSSSLSSITKSAGFDSPLNLDPLWMMPDGTNLTAAEQCYPITLRFVQLQEQRVSLQAQALELEKQRFKWQRSSSKKKRELEKLHLDNKRMKLENERMSLQSKQRELEFECQKSEASVIAIDLTLERLQSKEKMEQEKKTIGIAF